MGGATGEDRDSDLVHKVEELTELHSFTESETKNVIDRFILGIGSVLSWGAVILIAVIIAAGYYQQVQMTRRRDGAPEQTQQQQSMQRVMKFMPLMFGFFSWQFTAGLGLYFATSNLFRIGQQALIIRLDDGDDDDEDFESSTASDAGDDDQSSGPSPHASKKRKKRRRK